MTKRQVIIGSAGLLLYLVVYATLCVLLPPDSYAATVVADVGLVTIEIAILAGCVLAFRRNRGSLDRWIWLLVAVWIAGNTAGDLVWSYYEIVMRVETVALPGYADIGYIAGYVAAVGILVWAALRTAGHLKLVEALLDGAMVAVAAAGLSWPLVLAPLVSASETDLGFWFSLAYPIADLVLIMVLASVFFSYLESERRRPPVYFLLICTAQLAAITGDFVYFAARYSEGGYLSGRWSDVLWLLAAALAGITALLGMRAGSRTHASRSVDLTPAASHTSTPYELLSRWRTAIPYFALPVLAGMFIMQSVEHGWVWNNSTCVLAYLGIALVGLLVLRQYVILMQNRGLNASLYRASFELETRVKDLADLNRRLEVLNDQSHHLNSLREVREVAAAGLEIASAFARSPAGWIALRDDSGSEAVAVSTGNADDYCPGSVLLNAAQLNTGMLRALPLAVRSERLGTLWLAQSTEHPRQADLLPVIAAHIATAIDNARRYEEAVHLAEKDPLTGLYNHRGIHKRLAGETLRAQQNGSELSLIMIDLDNFKALNDTYGHPAGDSVLKQVSDAIRAVLRHADLAGRVGGDELLLVLPNTGPEGALQLGERLRVALAARPYVTAEGHSIPVRMSLGVATFPEDARSLSQLLETADANLYASKELGGNTTTGSAPDQAASEDVEGVLGVVGKLLSVVGARNHYTRRHSESVVLYALALGEAMGLPEDSLRTLHLAAMLHDVGNIGVPADLLCSPDPLTPAEEDMMRRHAQIGADVISDLPRLAEVARAIRAHHERHDGEGYPEEMSGADIPLLGRILAVADAYSAMILDRPYRKSMSCAEARAELLRAAGSQLDPELVETFVRLLDERQRQRSREPATG